MGRYLSKPSGGYLETIIYRLSLALEEALPVSLNRSRPITVANTSIGRIHTSNVF